MGKCGPTVCPGHRDWLTQKGVSAKATSRDPFLFFTSCSKSMSGCPDQDANQPRTEKLLLVLGRARARHHASCRNLKDVFLVPFVPHPFLSLHREASLAGLGWRLDGSPRGLYRPLLPGRWASALLTQCSIPPAELLAPLCQATCVKSLHHLGTGTHLAGHQLPPCARPASPGPAQVEPEEGSPAAQAEVPRALCCCLPCLSLPS